MRRLRWKATTPIRFGRFYRECLIDSRRYLKAAAVSPESRNHEVTHLESHIVRRYHVIEKGLSMPDFRPRFGNQVVMELYRLLQKWDSPGNLQVASAWRVLEAYRARHEELGIEVDNLFGSSFEVPVEYRSCGGGGGVRDLKSPSSDDRAAFSRVFRARSSVRAFLGDALPSEAIIRSAVEMAISSPSVCNRQTWRVHLFKGADAQGVLKLQNGNRGFGHTIPIVLIITTDMRHFVGSIERYQPWIDGGMFSMSLLLALHAKGLGAVPLNWAVVNKRDKKLRKLCSLPDYERVIMLVGCGHPAPDAKIPISFRRDVEEILRSREGLKESELE